MARDIVPHTPQGGAVAAYCANPWAEAAKDVMTGDYLKFNGNDGIWSYGKEDNELVPGSRVVADMTDLAFGWICWVNSSVEEEVFVGVMEGKPPFEHELTDHGPYDKDDGWRAASRLNMVLESVGDDDQHEDVGSPLLWKSSTGGQVTQVKRLSGAYGRVFNQHPGELPVIELDAESYAPKDKKYGKIKWSPVLKIVGWITEAELASFARTGGEDEGEEEVAAAPPPPPPARTAPAPRGRGRAAPAEEPAAEAPPARGRGRAAPAPEAEEQIEDDVPPARGRRGAAPAEVDEDAAPPARGRSPGRRGATPPPADDADDDQGEPEPAAAPAPRAGGRTRSFR